MVVIACLLLSVVRFTYALDGVGSPVPGTDIEGLQEFCERDVFHASCRDDEVILITHGRYGRMREGRCITSNYGVTGCFTDVRTLLDASCSGRRTCDAPVSSLVPDKAQPCPPDFRSYLEVAFKCIQVVTVGGQQCRTRAGGPIEVRENRGYLSSLVARETGCGSFDNPWWITVPSGRRIKLTLIDFGLAAAVGPLASSSSTGSQPATPPSGVTCHVYAVVKEESMASSHTVCGSSTTSSLAGAVSVGAGVNSGGADLRRETVVFESTTNIIEVRLGGRKLPVGGNAGGGATQLVAGGSSVAHFLLHFEAVGCADPMPPRHGTMQRMNNDVIMTCNNDSSKSSTANSGSAAGSSAVVAREQWHLTCEGDQWIGTQRNCTAAYTSGVISWGLLEKSQGISIVLILSIAFAVGISMVVVGSLYLRRQRVRREAALQEQADHLAAEYLYRLKSATTGGPPLPSHPLVGCGGGPATLRQNSADFEYSENDYDRSWGKVGISGGTVSSIPGRRYYHGGPHAQSSVSSCVGSYPLTVYSDLTGSSGVGTVVTGGGCGGEIVGSPNSYQHYVEHVYESPKFDRRDIV